MSNPELSRKQYDIDGSLRSIMEDKNVQGQETRSNLMEKLGRAFQTPGNEEAKLMVYQSKLTDKEKRYIDRCTSVSDNKELTQNKFSLERHLKNILDEICIEEDSLENCLAEDRQTLKQQYDQELKEQIDLMEHCFELKIGILKVKIIIGEQELQQKNIKLQEIFSDFIQENELDDLIQDCEIMINDFQKSGLTYRNKEYEDAVEQRKLYVETKQLYQTLEKQRQELKRLQSVLIQQPLLSSSPLRQKENQQNTSIQSSQMSVDSLPPQIDPKELMKRELDSIMKELEIASKDDLETELQVWKDIYERSKKTMALSNIQKLTKAIEICDELYPRADPIKELKKQMAKLLENFPDIKDEAKIAENVQFFEELVEQFQRFPTKVKIYQEQLDQLKEIQQIQHQIYKLQNPNSEESKESSSKNEKSQEEEEVKNPEQMPLQPEKEEVQLTDEEKEKLNQAYLYERELFEAINIMQLYNDSNMPSCFELSIVKILYFVILLLHQAKDVVFSQSSQQIQAQIQKLSKQLDSQCIKEKQNYHSLAPHIKKIVQECETPSLEIVKSLRAILLEIRLFSFQEFFDLYSKADEAAQQIAKKNVILMLGSTGCGKSTTIHYLGGSKLEKISVKGLPHIQPTQIYNKDLLKVRNSPYSKSETRYIATIRIDLKNLGYHRSEEIILVDSPGSEDTESSEVDLSNGLSIIKAISVTAGIRPVIIFSYQDIGSRKTKFKQQLFYYIRIIKNVAKAIKNFIYCFSHYQKDSTPIEAMLTEISSNLSIQEQQDDNFKKILDDMIEKAAAGKILVLDPLDGKPIDVLKKFIDVESIVNPSQAFQMAVSDNTHSKIITQFAMHEKAILEALHQQDEAIISFKLRELLQFLTIFNSNQSYQSKYQEILKKMQEAIEHNFDQGINQITKCLAFDNTFTHEEFKTFKKHLQFAKNLENVTNTFLQVPIDGSSSSHLQKSTPTYNDMIAAVVQQTRVCFGYLQSNDIDKKEWSQFLKKTDILCELQDPTISDLISESFNIFHTKLEGSVAYCMNALNNLQIHEYSGEENKQGIMHHNEDEKQAQQSHQIIGELCRKLETAIQNFNSFQQVQEAIAKQKKIISESVLKRINLLKDKQISVFLSPGEIKQYMASSFQEDEDNYTELLPEQIKKINSFINLVESFKSSLYMLTEQDFQLKLEQPENEVIQKLVEIYTCNDKKIREYIKDYSKYSQIKRRYDQIINLLDVQEVANTVRFKFNSIIHMIENLVETQTKSIQDILLKMRMQQQDRIEMDLLQQLKDALYCISDLSWISSQSVDFYKKKQQDLKSMIQNKVSDIEEDVKHIIIDVEDSKCLLEIDKAQTKFIQLSEICNILNLQINTTKKEEWYNQIRAELGKIRSFLNLWQQGDRRVLKRVECQNFQFYHDFLIQLLQCSKIVQGNDLASTANSLFQELKVILDNQRDAITNDVRVQIQIIKQEEDSTKAEDAISVITLHLKLMKEMKDNHKKLWSFVDKNYKIDEELVETIKKELFNKLFAEIGQAQRDKNAKLFNIKMGVLNSSISLGSFVFDDSKEVWKRIENFEKENVKQQAQAVQMASASLNENEFEGIAIILNQSVQSGAQANVIEIQKLIQKKIKELIKQIENFSKDEEIDPQQAEQQYILIDMLHSLTTNIEKSNYLDLVVKIEIAFQRFKNKVTQSCKQLIEQATIHLKKYRFYSAQESLKAASLILKKSQIIQNKGQAGDGENFIDFQSLDAEIKKAQQLFQAQKEGLIKKIIDMDIYKFEQREINPKEIMENLVKDRQQFSEFIEEIHQHISKKYYGAIAKVNNDFVVGTITDSDLRNEYIVLQKSLEFLPSEQTETLSAFITVEQNKMEKQISSQSREFDQRIETTKELNEEFKKVLENGEKKKIPISQKNKEIINKIVVKLCQNASKQLEIDHFQILFNESLPKIQFAMDAVFTKYYTTSTEQEIQQLFNAIRRKFDCIIQVLIERVSPLYQEICQQKNIEVEEIVILSSIEMKDGGRQMIESINAQNDDASLIQILIALHKFRIQKPQEMSSIINQYDKRFNTLMERGGKLLSLVKSIFEDSIRQKKIQEGTIAIMFLKKTLPLYNQLKQKEVEEILSQDPSELSFQASSFLKLVKETQYKSCVLKLEPVINAARENFNYSDLINDKTRYGEKERQQFYQNLKDSFKLLQSALVIKADIKDALKFDVESLVKMSQQNFENSIQSLTKRIEKSIKNFQSSDKVDLLKEFGLLYSNLESLIIVFPEQKQVQEIQEKIDAEVETQLQEMKSKALEIGSKNIKNFVKILVNLQKIRENILMLDSMVTEIVNEVLEIVMQQQGNNLKQNAFVNVLAQELKSTVEGDSITKLNPMFEGYDRALFNEKILKKTIQEVLKELEGDNISIPELESAYTQFNECYRQIIKENLRPDADLDSVRSRTFLNSKKYEGKPLDDNAKDRIPILVAHIFSLWTLLNAEQYFKLGSDGGMMKGDGGVEDQNAKYLLQPHIAQVISIFRVLGIGYTQFNKPTRAHHPLKAEQVKMLGDVEPLIYDNLVQIKTGEGKSVTLAVVSIIFALYGFEVNCACYSEYLSQRDYEAFLKLFSFLGVESQIFYGTFNQICEKYINKDGVIRDLVLNRILKNQQQVSNFSAMNGQERPKALLIDEVDVFFSKDFYNAAYLPMTLVKGPQICAIIDLIWERRDEKLTFRQIKTTSQYTECVQLFQPQFVPLLDGAIRNMLLAVQPDPVHNNMMQVVNGKIGYKDQDTINFKIRYGYKTVFAYYREYDKKTVSLQTLNENKAIGINCGVFSYAEIPHYFGITMGVTGTLKQLTGSEKHIISEVFQIRNFTYSPSVYGPSNLFWKTNPERIRIEPQNNYFREIVNQMNRKLEGESGKRAVLIFFKSEKHLENFFLSAEFENYKASCQKLTELLNEKEKKACINKATYPNTITLSTPSFGRGTDFICRDQGVERNGGVHVIQTYFSESLSEFVQIKGRTARQGNKGSYSMILLDFDLKEFNIEESDLKSQEMKMTPHKVLKCKREEKLAKGQQEDTQALAQIKKQHEESWSIKKILQQNDAPSIQNVLKFLEDVNPSPPDDNIVKNLVLMDATGSMNSLLNNAKNAVNVMFERANAILKENKIPENSFMIQFACYRNYSSGKDMLLENSNWESNPIELRKFLDRVQVSGGQGREAVEVGLEHANRIVALKEDFPLSQVFIIGDVAPNTREEVASRRKQYAESYWADSRFAKETYWETELEKLKTAKIPVHPFYVHSRAKAGFELLAINGGKSQFLDVNDPQIGQKVLTDMITMQVLEEIGNKRGGSEVAKRLVQSYQKSYA